MKKLSKIKLTQLAQSELNERELCRLLGGGDCRCSCLCGCQCSCQCSCASPDINSSDSTAASNNSTTSNGSTGLSSSGSVNLASGSDVIGAANNSSPADATYVAPRG